MVNDAIRTEGLTKRFDTLTAVDQLDLSVPTGTVHGLLGPNGAGKTTTVRMITGALPPSDGEAFVLGHPIQEDADTVKRRVGVVFGENITPEPTFSPIRYLRYVGSLYGLDKHTIDDRARRLFDLLGLMQYAERPTRELSGGNKRKVEIARSLLHGPQVLFLDEPTRELDIPSKHEMWRFFNKLAEDLNVTIFLSSHDVQEIATLCSRVTILHGGRKTWQGSIEQLEADGDLTRALMRLLTHQREPQAAD